MRLKQFASLLAALLLAVLAVPAFAAPEDEVLTIGEPFSDAQTEDGGLTAAPGYSIDPRMPGEDGEEAAEEATFVAVMATEPQTTIGIVPISDDTLLLAPEEDEGLFSQRSMTLAALALSGLAVLLSVVALARSRKKTPPNATGNYQKYF